MDVHYWRCKDTKVFAIGRIFFEHFFNTMCNFLNFVLKNIHYERLTKLRFFHIKNHEIPLRGEFFIL